MSVGKIISYHKTPMRVFIATTHEYEAIKD